MPHKAKVLVSGSIPPHWLSDLDDIAHLEIWQGKGPFLMPRSEMLSVIGSFDALINFAETIANEEFINAAPKLKIIANVSIGYDNLDLQLLSSRGKWATNAPGFFNYPVAEYALAGILALLRKLIEADAYVRNDEWNAFEPGRWDGVSLKDQTVGIVGLGSTGRELKKMVESLGAKTIYCNPSPRPDDGQVSFDELIALADVISIHVPLNPTTQHLFDKNVISRMKKGAMLVNTSRGRILDQSALMEALLSGKLAGAVLDVFENEPDVPDALRQMKNVILTPHMAGGTRHAREACVRCAARNVAEALKGNRPANALNNVI